METFMTKAGHTTAGDLILRELGADEWVTIFALNLSKKGQKLLATLRGNGNRPVRVSDAGYLMRHSAVSQLNQKLRWCGESGYYLQRTDNKCWPETSLQLYVRKSR
jgi:hypothetical protein